MAKVDGETGKVAERDIVTVAVTVAPGASQSQERRLPDADAGSPSDPPEVDLLLDGDARYREGELLGEGGMGSVRLFEDLRIGREVALKRMREGGSADRRLRARFLREARVQGQLEHPSIVPVYDVGAQPGGEPYFTMRRVEGETLAEVLDLLRRGDATAGVRWSERRLLTAFVSVCLAVHYAHTKGVLHRDLKPSNIMLGAFGEVYVLDWGLARRVDLPPTSTRAALAPPDLETPIDGHALTQEGTVLGTPPYMAPEQIMGDPDLDARADVYALGLILHEIYARRSLHAGRTFHQIARAAVAGIDARPSLVNPGTPPEVDAICARATAADRDDRLASALELAASLERFLDGVRDTERRRELAAQAASRAAEALARAERETDDPSREQGRSAAMREVIGALALDAEEPRARELMVALLTDVPRTPPPAVQRELEEAAHAARQRGLRLASWVWSTWLLTIPAVYFLGVRSMTAFLTECALVLAGTLLCFDMARRPKIDRGRAVAMALITASVLGALAMWLGPFVLLPSATSAVLMLLCSHSRAAERKPLIAIAALVVLAPVGLEWAGVVPPSFAFEPDRLCLLARAVDVRPVPTLAMLIWSTLGFVIVPALMLTKLRDQLDAAQSKLALQSWQLRQLGRGRLRRRLNPCLRHRRQGPRAVGAPRRRAQQPRASPSPWRRAPSPGGPSRRGRAAAPRTRAFRRGPRRRAASRHTDSPSRCAR